MSVLLIIELVALPIAVAAVAGLIWLLIKEVTQ